MLGETISHFRIIEKLGHGGMGEVYLAEDTRLGRKVALKFLAPELARDRESLIRFRNEARAAAELSHPNIATIFDFDEVDGKPFLILEYLEGQTLRERCAQGPLPIDDVARIGKALAAGLSEAHSQGIVHRDMKSANVMLTGKGEVKILDFGLAHRIDATRITREGTTLGTISYMSPEQARGERATERSDIWSLGIVLYECLTGRLPFIGEGSLILEQIKASPVPPPTGLRTGVPMELEQIVLRCLEKDPDLRFQHADELLASFRAMESYLSSPGLQTAPHPPARGKRSPAWPRAAVALAVLALVLLVWQQPWRTGQSRDADSNSGLALSPPKASPFLSTDALETSPAWSPTGNLIAYSASSNGAWDIWLCDLDGSNPINLTNSPESTDDYPEWSPDGQRIAFYSNRDGPGIYAMTVTGGNVRRVVSVDQRTPNNAGFCIQWIAPDRMIYTEIRNGSRPDIYEYRLSTGESRCLTASSHDGAHYGRINRAGSHLVYVRPWLGVDTEIFVQDLQTDEVHTMPLLGRFARWTPDGRSLLVISTVDGSSDLWVQEVDFDRGGAGGQYRRLTSALSLGDVAPSPDGSRAIVTRQGTTTNVWSLPTDMGPLTDLSEAQQLTDDAFNHHWATWLPGGNEFIEVSDRRGIMNVWKLGVADGSRVRLTEEDSFAAVPSPDGKWIIVTKVEDQGATFPYLMRSDGGGLRELAPSLRDEYLFADVTDWSTDGKRLAFHTKLRDGDGSVIIGYLTVDEEGADVRDIHILPGRGGIPFWSPDGRFMVFQRTVGEQADLFVTNLAGDDVYQLTDDERVEWVCGWELDPSRIYYHDGVTEAVYRVLMNSDGRPESDPEIWLSGSGPVTLRQWLDFQDGRAIGPMTAAESDLWFLEFDGVESAMR